MKIDISDICKRQGLLPYEISALLGSNHSNQLRLVAIEEHRPMTIAFYWLLQHLPEQVIPTLLDRWLYDKPKDEEQVRLLIQIARRHKKIPRFKIWDKAIRRMHPEFF